MLRFIFAFLFLQGLSAMAVTTIMQDSSANVLGGPYTFSNVVSQTTSATSPNNLVRFADFTNSIRIATNTVPASAVITNQTPVGGSGITITGSFAGGGKPTNSVDISVVRTNQNAVGGTGITITGTLVGGGVQTNTLANTAVTPATYGTATAYPSIAINQQGQITAASNITVNPAVVIIGSSSISDAITGGITNTLSLSNTAVTAGTYGTATAYPSFAVGADGRLTAASNITVSTTPQVVTNGLNLYSGTSTNVYPGVTIFGTNTVLNNGMFSNYVATFVARDTTVGKTVIFAPQGFGNTIARFDLGRDTNNTANTASGNVVHDISGTDGTIWGPSAGTLTIGSGNSGGSGAFALFQATKATIQGQGKVQIYGGGGPVIIGRDDVPQFITQYFPGNTNQPATNFCIYSFSNPTIPAMGTFVTNGAFRTTIAITAYLTSTATEEAKAAIYTFDAGGATNILAFTSKGSGTTSGEVRTLNFDVGNGRIWYPTNLSVGAATAITTNILYRIQVN